MTSKPGSLENVNLSDTVVPFIPYKNFAERQLLTSLVERYGSPLMLLDCNIVRSQYRALQAALPKVKLHFALKPLPHPAVIHTLKREGAHFDLASNGEVDMVREAGIAPEQTIHSHPIKRDSDIRHALEYGCNVFVIDSIHELEKFIPYRERVELLVRLSFRNAQAFSDLSKKFGCTPAGALAIIQHAHDLGISVKGLSFHVGSQTPDATKYLEAIRISAEVIQTVENSGLPPLVTLDIGGGFPVDYGNGTLPIQQFCEPIRRALKELPESIAVIAEPGRFIVAPAVTNICSVMGQAQREGKAWYYLDDGIYGSYSGMLFDHAVYPIDSLITEGERFPSVLAGPTCDSIDVIAEEIMLPKLKDGDLIIGNMMGAYTSAHATEFNFFRKASFVVFNETSETETVSSLYSNQTGV